MDQLFGLITIVIIPLALVFSVAQWMDNRRKGIQTTPAIFLRALFLVMIVLGVLYLLLVIGNNRTLGLDAAIALGAIIIPVVLGFVLGVFGAKQAR